MTQKNTPDWINKAPKKNSYRSIFKYGDPLGFKHPNEKLVKELKHKFKLSEKDFKEKESTGNEIVDLEIKSKLSIKQIDKFAEICGKQNVSSKEYDRLKFSTGKTIEEAMKLRKQQIEQISDLVVHPRNDNDISEIVKYCHIQKIPIYVFGGGSSVNFGYFPEKGGVTIVLSTHMNKIISVNELNQTVKVQAGMYGPAFEEALNKAPELYHTKHKFTCGHFPQSFEYSTVGGWFITLSSGQQSSYYGDAGDLVLGVKMISPAGEIITKDYPATATGPKILDMIKGSEGIFGIITELTWKLYRYQPENRRRFSFIFPSWESAVDASREISQGEFGMPAVFRISDPEETHHGLKLYGIEDTIFDKLMKLKGFKPMERCLFLGTADGDKRFTKTIKSRVRKICKKHGGFNLTAFPVKKWEPGRYKDPYLREDLMDYGILIDTLETGVNWDNFHQVHQQCRTFVKSRPNTICMSHASHFYAQGTNLYFIFIIKEDDIEAYRNFQKGLIDTIQKSGGSLSHHHGVGRMISKWMPEHLGENQIEILRSLKKHFDPNNIMNPGNQLIPEK
ncbi:MAG: FAD-binding oxidoreductase [Bacteroidota bacterium]|nr:FAD-binding oxidoreductase [Bacteroidota bacterium]